MPKVDSFCCILNLYNEPYEMVHKCITAFKKYHPNHELLIICYEDDNYSHDREEFERLRALSNHIIIDNNVKSNLNTGGLFTENYLKFFLDHSESNYLVKIDPDTIFLNQLSVLNANKVTANIYTYNKNKIPILANSCMAFPRKIVEKILASGLLTSKKYSKNKASYTCLQRNKAQEPDSKYLNTTFQGAILLEILQQIGIAIQDNNNLVCYNDYSWNNHQEEILSEIKNFKKVIAVHPCDRVNLITDKQ